MSRFSSSILGGIAAAALLSLPGLASAADISLLNDPELHLSGPVALSSDEMARESGGDVVKVEALSSQQLEATATHNNVSADVINSGDVTFAKGALDNFAGIGNFVINTGANNIVQGTIAVTIAAAPSL